MSIINAYSELNKYLLNVIDSVSTVSPIYLEDKLPQIRLESSPFVLTEEIERSCAVVTAHDLEQYKPKFYSIKLQENTRTWLDELLEPTQDSEV